MKARQVKKAIEGPIAGVRQEVADVRHEVADVRHEVAAVRQQLDSTRADLEHHIGEVKASLEQKIETLGTNLERQMSANVETGRRHMDVIAEEFRSLVRLGLDRQMDGYARSSLRIHPPTNPNSPLTTAD